MSAVSKDVAPEVAQRLAAGLSCPAPLTDRDRVLLGHGSGGKLSAALVRDRFLPHFNGAELAQLGDAAVVNVSAGSLAISTDSFVVNPLEFPGGNIGTLAVNGTVNDVALMGARPLWITVGFILEEGLPLLVLDRVIAEMARAAKAAGVSIVTGDTKVVERGKADGMFINTTGVGIIDPNFRPAPGRARAGDAVIVSGNLGVHGITIMAAREGIAFDVDLESDSAALVPLVDALRDAVGVEIRALRDPTRGGVASTLNEIAAASKVGVVLDETMLPVPTAVAGACEMLGLDALYVANEGIFVAIVPDELAEQALQALRALPLGANARRIGHCVAQHPGMVVMRTAIGGTRVVDMLPGDQLPRIC
jgi:hydrogenase expression/formation protein HypE